MFFCNDYPQCQFGKGDAAVPVRCDLKKRTIKSVFSSRVIGLFLLVAITMVLGVPKAQAVYSTGWATDLSWVSAPTLETTLSASDDALSAPISLPFAFPFQDEVFTSLRIHTNGFVVLGSSGNLPCGSCFNPQRFEAQGQSNAPDYMLAPWWADWNPAASGDVLFGFTNGRFVVEWRGVQPYGARGTYNFEVQLFPDGHFEFHYGAIHPGNAAFDGLATGSVGFQGRSAARFASSLLFNSGDIVRDFSRASFQRASDKLDVTRFNRKASVPDLVERWAPVIWADITASTGRCDFLTAVDFDGNFKGLDNATHMNNQSFPIPGVVYYSLVEGATHAFIGYYFYHAKNCSDGTHEHDWEGVVMAVNRSTGALDAVLTNVHGNEIPYRSPFNPLIATVPHTTDYGDAPTFTPFTVQDAGLGMTYDTLGVGIEAGTHAVWGRWHNKCVVGRVGSPSGCDDSHGGDGVVYVYGGVGTEPTYFPQYPNWFDARKSYELRPIRDLFNLAMHPLFCGQDQATALYACRDRGRPWDIMNSAGDDEGDLPWVWGLNGVVGGACREPNMLLFPGYLFWGYFRWPGGVFNGCSYNTNEYLNAIRSVCVPSKPC